MLQRALNWIGENRTSALLVALATAAFSVDMLHLAGLLETKWFDQHAATVTLMILSLLAAAVVDSYQRHIREIKELTGAVNADAASRTALAGLGVTRIWTLAGDVVKDAQQRRSKAKTLQVLTVTGSVWALQEQDALRDMISRGGRVEVILAKPGTEFMALREQREGQSRLGAFAKEIENVLGIFQTITSTADTSRGGSLEVRQVAGDIVCRLEIFDESTAFWTSAIPPARSWEDPCFEVDLNSGKDLPGRLRTHFQTLWAEGAGCVQVKWPAEPKPDPPAARPQPRPRPGAQSKSPVVPVDRDRRLPSGPD